MFKPSLHGWGFDDSFSAGGSALGLGAAPARFGLGGGMCWAALDRYLDGRAIPHLESAPEPGSPLQAEILQRQIAALTDVWPRIRHWQSLPDGSWRDRLPIGLSPGRRDVASLTRAGWPALRRSIAAQRPVLLTLVHSEDPYARAIAARQVLAYDSARAGAVVTLSIYDPDRPGDDEVRLAFSLNGPLDARATGGQRVRGFFTVPYDREPAACVHAETFADRAVLGLGRKVRGKPRAAAGRRALHVVARDGAGALIHFHRRYGRHWDGENVSELTTDAPELHSDPAALAGPGGIGFHAFARSYVGDLVHFRSLRRWRVANRTEHRNAGPRFRLDGDPVPVALPWGAMCVVGRGREGALVAYSALPFRGWRAEEVPPPAASVIDGNPVAAPVRGVLHVIARARNGHLLHFERTKGGWSVGDLVTLCAGAEPVKSAPVLVVHDHRPHVFGVTADGRLLHLVLGTDGQWKAAVVMDGVQGEPTVTAGPAGLHAFAVAASPDGLLHAWPGANGWRVEDLVGSRSSSRPGLSPTEGLRAWGSNEELRVFGRREGALVQWVWRADSDWVSGAVAERAGVAARHEPGEDPLLMVDIRGAFHLFATDGSGAVVHLERGAWRASSARVKGVEAGATARTAAAAGAPAAAGTETGTEAKPLEEMADDFTLPESEKAGQPAGVDWGRDAHLNGADDAGAPVEVEPLDLERLESWPPKPKAPTRPRTKGAEPLTPEPSSPPPAWPEEG